ncbi:hypothetical protein BLOT_003386 [Blomia tropicalis]|nr:hypothetical protein BLOT_003386 [Blomia tropicalis]
MYCVKSLRSIPFSIDAVPNQEEEKISKNKVELESKKAVQNRIDTIDCVELWFRVFFSVPQPPSCYSYVMIILSVSHC